MDLEHTHTPGITKTPQPQTQTAQLAVVTTRFSA